LTVSTRTRKHILKYNDNKTKQFFKMEYDHRQHFRNKAGLMYMFSAHKNCFYFGNCRLVVAGYLLQPGVLSDALACVELYKHCGNPVWSFNEEVWPKTMQGVLASRESIPNTERSAISRNGRLKTLTLYDAELAGEIPTQIGALTSLVHLDLSWNRLVGEIPIRIGALTSLTVLDLSNNRLTGEIPTQIGALISLTSLVLSYNHLTGEIPTQIGALTSLTTLSLYMNQLTCEIPTQIGALTSLTMLSLHMTLLTGDISTQIGAFTWKAFENNTR
jgi:Leucine-rich repeat (LRR) protein